MHAAAKTVVVSTQNNLEETIAAATDLQVAVKITTLVAAHQRVANLFTQHNNSNMKKAIIIGIMAIGIVGASFAAYNRFSEEIPAPCCNQSECCPWQHDCN